MISARCTSSHRDRQPPTLPADRRAAASRSPGTRFAGRECRIFRHRERPAGRGDRRCTRRLQSA